jgi:hypothetical protein
MNIAIELINPGPGGDGQEISLNTSNLTPEYVKSEIKVGL